MTSIEDRWPEDSPVPNLVSWLDQYEEALLERRSAALDNDAGVEAADSFLAVVAHIRRALGEVDTRLTPNGLLSGLTSSASKAKQELDTHGVLGQNHINIADGLKDNAARLASIPPAGPSADVFLHASIETSGLLETAAEELARLRVAADQAESSAASATASVGALADRIDAEFEARRSETSSKLQEIVNEREGDRVQLVKETTSRIEDADQLLGELRKKLALAADISLSAGYRHATERELEAADENRRKAVRYGLVSACLAIVGVLGHAAMVLLTDAGAGESVTLLVSKLAAVGAFAGIATYYGRQSGLHRHEGERLRQVQLELENIGEYLAEFGTEDRNEIRRLLVARYFRERDGDPHLSGPTLQAASASLVNGVAIPAESNGSPVS